MHSLSLDVMARCTLPTARCIHLPRVPAVLLAFSLRRGHLLFVARPLHVKQLMTEGGVSTFAGDRTLHPSRCHKRSKRCRCHALQLDKVSEPEIMKPIQISIGVAKYAIALC